MKCCKQTCPNSWAGWWALPYVSLGHVYQQDAWEDKGVGLINVLLASIYDQASRSKKCAKEYWLVAGKTPFWWEMSIWFVRFSPLRHHWTKWTPLVLNPQHCEIYCTKKLLSQQHCCYNSVIESNHKNALVQLARYYVIVLPRACQISRSSTK